MKLNLDERALNRVAENHPEVVDECIRLARRISDRARAKTPVGTGKNAGRAKNSHRVEVDRTLTPPRIAAVAGEGSAWYYTFIEHGGVGFRPPPAPMRSAAKAEGLRVERITVQSKKRARREARARRR